MRITSDRGGLTSSTPALRLEPFDHAITRGRLAPVAEVICGDDVDLQLFGWELAVAESAHARLAADHVVFVVEQE